MRSSLFSASTYNLHQRVLDGKWMGLGVEEEKSLQQIIEQEKQGKVISAALITELDILVEQFLEARKIKHDLRVASSANRHVKPYAIAVIEHDDNHSIQARIYCPSKPNLTWRYGMTYNSGDRDEYRAKFMARLEQYLEDARRDPYGFFE